MREEDIDKLREQLNQKAELSEEDMAEVVRLDRCFRCPILR